MRKDIFLYHFLRIPTENTWEFIDKVSSFEAVACFDFEDSIQNPFESCDSNLKIEIRNKILNFIRTGGNKLANKKIGMRINNFHSIEFSNDLSFLNNVNKHLQFSCIFLPKVESSEEIISCINTLKKSNIFYKELIPVIETVKGFSNLSKIIFEASDCFDKFAFGHCDFNLDNNLFPFHHQYSPIYWNWIDVICSAIKHTSKVFINSPFLFLNDDITFKNILATLQEKCNHTFGQITLSLNQTKTADEFRYQSISANPDYFKDDAIQRQITAEMLVQTFEKNKLENRSFAVTPDKKILISPHEYKAAKSFRISTATQDNKLCFLIVGGCFTQQHNIEPSRLYHQLLKTKMNLDASVELELDIIRYERLTKCLEKVTSVTKIRKPHLLLFHIRPEPLLRISKLCYRYKNDKGNLKISINLAFLTKILAEDLKYKIAPIDRTYEYPTESFAHHLLVDFNHLFGIIIGNFRYGLKRYLDLVLEINKYCKSNDIRFITIGPVSRPHTFLENKLASKLDRFIESAIKLYDIPYVKCIGVFSDEKRKLFSEEGIFVNEEGHDRVANLIYDALIKYNLISFNLSK